MREITFRVWDKKHKEMCPVTGINFRYMGFQLTREITDSTTWHVGDFELMQYTGLHDRNKKPIFEGDIVKVNDSFYTIKYEAPLFRAITSNGHGSIVMNKYCMEYIEIIGNIYESPELLKGEK